RPCRYRAATSRVDGQVVRARYAVCPADALSALSEGGGRPHRQAARRSGTGCAPGSRSGFAVDTLPARAGRHEGNARRGLAEFSLAARGIARGVVRTGASHAHACVRQAPGKGLGGLAALAPWAGTWPALQGGTQP